MLTGSEVEIEPRRISHKNKDSVDISFDCIFPVSPVYCTLDYLIREGVGYMCIKIKTILDLFLFLCNMCPVQVHSGRTPNFDGDRSC